MTDPKAVHNEAAPRILREIVGLTGGAIPHMNVLAESILLGVAMYNFPLDPRRQALMIQEIADAAADRVKVAGK